MIERIYKYTCDRCNKEINSRPLRVQIQMYGKMSSGINGYKTEDRFDLCPDCMKKVITLLHDKKGEQS